MKPVTHDTVQKLWALCHVLRDDGITYHQYVTELVFLLFLKMAKETAQEKELPGGWRWDDLRGREGVAQLQFYKNLLLHLGAEGGPRVRAIYTDATTALRKPQSLKKLVDSIDAIDWFSSHREELGDLYEGLLERNASELKSGAGQYFTPRPLVDCMVALVKPRPGESVQDPAAGTAGFLIAADRYVKAATHDLFDLDERTQAFQRKSSRTALPGEDLMPVPRDVDLGIEAQIIATQEKENLWSKVEALGEPARSLLILTYQEGLTSQEIADVMGYKSPEVVRQLRKRAIDKLR